MRTVSVYIAILCLIAIATPMGAQVCAGFGGGPITANYLAGTKKCSIGETVFGSSTACADDGGKEAIFDQTLTVFQAATAGGGWATWNVPPFAESPQPYVGFTNGNSELTITYRKLQSVVGMEIEPNLFAQFNITMNLMDQFGNPLASLTLAPNGAGGSLLFAGVCNMRAIKTVQIVADPAAAGFAVAQLRGDNMPGFAIAVKPPDVGPRLTAPPSGATRNH